MAKLYRKEESKNYSGALRVVLERTLEASESGTFDVEINLGNLAPDEADMVRLLSKALSNYKIGRAHV